MLFVESKTPRENGQTTTPRVCLTSYPCIRTRIEDRPDPKQVGGLRCHGPTLSHSTRELYTGKSLNIGVVAGFLVRRTRLVQNVSAVPPEGSAVADASPADVAQTAVTDAPVVGDGREDGPVGLGPEVPLEVRVEPGVGVLQTARGGAPVPLPKVPPGKRKISL